MAELDLKYDDTTGRVIAKQAGTSLPFTDKSFTVAGGGEDTFALDVDVSASTIIDAHVNDRRNFKSQDFTVDDVTDEVIFNTILPEGTFVHIRAWIT